MARRFARAIRRIYPQLATIEFEWFWSGDLSFPVHRMPQIGEIQPGVWLAGGFGEQGLNTTALAGQLIARAIVDGDDTWRLFRPFELVWAGGRSGRVVAKTALWWLRQRNRLAGEISFRREERERRLLREASPREKPVSMRADRDPAIAIPDASNHDGTRPATRPEQPYTDAGTTPAAGT